MQIMIILKVEGVFLGKIQFLHFLEKELHDFMIKVRKKDLFSLQLDTCTGMTCVHIIFYKRELVKLNTDVIPIVILKLHFKRDQCLGIMDNHI